MSTVGINSQGTRSMSLSPGLNQGGGAFVAGLENATEEDFFNRIQSIFGLGIGDPGAQGFGQGGSIAEQMSRILSGQLQRGADPAALARIRGAGRTGRRQIRRGADARSSDAQARLSALRDRQAGAEVAARRNFQQSALQGSGGFLQALNQLAQGQFRPVQAAGTTPETAGAFGGVNLNQRPETEAQARQQDLVRFAQNFPSLTDPSKRNDPNFLQQIQQTFGISPEELANIPTT